MVREAVIQVRESGVWVSFATGRMFEAIVPWVHELGLRAPQVCNNAHDGLAEAIRLHI